MLERLPIAVIGIADLRLAIRLIAPLRLYSPLARLRGFVDHVFLVLPQALGVLRLPLHLLGLQHLLVAVLLGQLFGARRLLTAGSFLLRLLLPLLFLAVGLLAAFVLLLEGRLLLLLLLFQGGLFLLLFRLMRLETLGVLRLLPQLLGLPHQRFAVLLRQLFNVQLFPLRLSFAVI